MHTWRARSTDRWTPPLAGGWVLVLFSVALMLGGCRLLDDLAQAIKGSTMRNRSLHVLVLPPLHMDSRSYAPDPINSQLHQLIVETLGRLNEAHNYAVSGYQFTDPTVVTRWYEHLRQTGGRQQREVIASLGASQEKVTQILFGQYQYNPTANTVGLLFYLYDKRTNTIGKEPANNFRWVLWQSREDVANHVGQMIRDLITRNF